MIVVERVGAQDAAKLVSALADLLIDAVEGGASVNFLTPLERTEAEAFWRRVALGVERSDRLLLGAFEGGALVGTAQLVLATQPNQQHRAEVAKVLVLQRARRRGIARRLLSALEEEARARGRTLLTLDTMVGSASEKLYASFGYVRVGAIPDYALWPNGTPGAASIFYKQLV
jgi:GNAT superfamily N-acetyltransferase